MSNESQNALAAFVKWLEEKHTQIMDCERRGIELLNAGDTQGYKDRMKEKAEMLRDLQREAVPRLAGIDADKRYEIERGIERFSSSASTALALNSTFYMSALLYPDEHKAGDPDNMELFIAAIKN